MDELPQKQSLPELVIHRLREGIRRGEWGGALPAERSLSETLQVSRSTLRLAIGQLKSEGWLEVAGRRTMIRGDASASRSGAVGIRRVVFLSPIPLERLPSHNLFVYAELGRKLSSLGATIQLENSPAFSHQRVAGYLDRLVSKSGADAWLLYRSPLRVQQYFQSRALPTVLFGNALEGIDLPALRMDYPAALRHCVSALLRLGHSRDRILLAIPEESLAGNVELQEAFLREVGEKSARQILRHREDYENVEPLLAGVFRRTWKPTAVIVLRTSAAARIHGLLQHRLGFSIPDDLSLACLEDAPFLAHLIPSIDRYRFDSAKIVQFVFTALSRQLSSGIVRGWNHRPFVPEYVAGETLGPPV